MTHILRTITVYKTTSLADSPLCTVLGKKDVLTRTGLASNTTQQHNNNIIKHPRTENFSS